MIFKRTGSAAILLIAFCVIIAAWSALILETALHFHSEKIEDAKTTEKNNKALQATVITEKWFAANLDSLIDNSAFSVSADANNNPEINVPDILFTKLEEECGYKFTAKIIDLHYDSAYKATAKEKGLPMKIPKAEADCIDKFFVSIITILPKSSDKVFARNICGNIIVSKYSSGITKTKTFSTYVN